jgi:flagellar hook-associated protein 1 FlgK
MSGTFSSFNTALSALRYNRVAMDTASQNIANVGVDGYTRRRVDAVTAGTPTKPAMWSRDQGTGGGVRITGVTRMADYLLDLRRRTEHGKQAYLDTRQTVLDRLETGIGEPGDDGVAAVLAEFRSAWADLSNTPDSDAARAQVISRGREVADALHLQASNFQSEAADQRVRANALVSEINTIASDLAATNKAIQVANLTNDDAGNLLDQRDQLALRLTELTGGRAEANGTGGLNVSVGGVELVTGAIAGSLSVASGITPTGDPDGNPVTFAVTHPINGTAPAAGLTGELGAVTDLLNTTIPAYLTGLGSVAQTLADGINALHQGGYDATGAAGLAFFTYDPADPAGTIAVNLTQNSEVAASSVAGGVVQGSNADALAAFAGADPAYQQLVNGFGTSVASGRRVSASQQMLTEQVDGARDQLAGVNLDEEMLSMVQYQRAYEAAARVMTVVDSMLDTLINRTAI